MKKVYVIGGIAAVVAIGVIGWIVLKGLTSDNGAKDKTTPQPIVKTNEQSGDTAMQPSGRYMDYSETLRSESGYGTTILFFHAPWCPECRAYDEAIKKDGVPSGVQVLKVDYDSSKDLRQQYGVTVQSTFVRVNSTGQQQAKWVGYGKEKSVQAILDNTK